MIQVINKSRQGIPVRVVRNGEEIVEHLRTNGELSVTTSEEVTVQLTNLQEKGLVVLRVIEDEGKSVFHEQVTSGSPVLGEDSEQTGKRKGK